MGESKSPKMQTFIDFKIKLALLEKIAFFIKENNFGVSLSEPFITAFLCKEMKALEEAREVPSGLQKGVILKELSTTGFVHIDEYGLSFNSTIFLNYFAAARLSKLYNKNSVVLKDKLEKVTWHDVIVIASSKLPDVTDFVKAIYQQGNVWIATACIIENTTVNREILELLLKDLEQCCNSVFPTIRNRSVYYLAQIDKSLTKEIFRRLTNSPYIGVKTFAIEEFSKISSSDASKIVYENLDWDKGGLEIGRTTQGGIARSLANLEDEESHLKIIDIWKKKVDMFTTEDCRLAMLQLVYSNKLTSRIRDSLLDFYLSNPTDKDVGFYSKIRGIADVFIALGDESIASRLIDGLTDEEKYYATLWETPKILSSFNSQAIFNLLIERSLDSKRSPLVRQAMITALVEAREFKIELPILEKLLSDEHFQVKRAAIKGLSKYAAYKVKDLLLRLINDIEVCGEATELLGDFGLLTVICDYAYFPKQFIPNVLFEQIRKHGIVEFLPLLKKFEDKWLSDERTDQIGRFLIDLAHTYVILGQINEALKIIRSFYVNGELILKENEYIYFDLAKLCPICGLQGLEILQDIYNSIERARISKNDPRLFILIDDAYLDGLEKIGGVEVIEIITKLCEQKIGDIVLFERAMRAIVHLSPQSKEDWLMHLLEENPQLKGADLHRAIEALGIIGTEKAIPMLKKIAKANISSEYILDTCFLAIEDIYYKKGKWFFATDKDILG